MIQASVLIAAVIYWQLPNITVFQALWLLYNSYDVRLVEMYLSAGAVLLSGIKLGN